mgnify:CR=1 FL=1
MGADAVSATSAARKAKDPRKTRGLYVDTRMPAHQQGPAYSKIAKRAQALWLGAEYYPTDQVAGVVSTYVGLAERAGKIHDKLRTFLASMDGIEGSLEKASQAYRKARDQLVDGRGNLVKQVNEFKELGVSVKAELSEEWTDRAALELSHERSEETP